MGHMQPFKFEIPSPPSTGRDGGATEARVGSGVTVAGAIEARDGATPGELGRELA